MIVKRIGPLSCARITGTLYAIVGLVAGAVLSLISLVAGSLGRDVRGTGFVTLLGAGSIVVLPLIYGTIGFLTTLIGAWLYNMLAGMVGGVEMDLQ